MAQVRTLKHLPNQSSRYSDIFGSKYILLDSGEYPEGINAFLQHRRNGGFSRRRSRRRLRPKTEAAAAERLCNYLTFVETDDAHPTLPGLDWKHSKEWHVRHLYENALRTGVWTQEFYATGSPSPLAAETIEARVNEVLLCYGWLEQEGYISNFNEEPPISAMEHAYRPISLGRKLSVQKAADEIVSPAYRVRQTPGSLIPPTLDQKRSFFAALQSNTYRPIAMFLYETGLRVSELVDGTLVPGSVHRRSPSAAFHLSSFPTSPYQLEWSANDSRMIGVLPPRDHAWRLEANEQADCAYRVVGKFLVIRRVDLPRRLLQSLWHYHDGTRAAILRRNGIRPNDAPAQLFLNKYGAPISVHAIQEAFRVTSDRLKCGYSFTPHALRHAFACDYLHSAILARAKLFDGSDQRKLNLDLIERHGEFCAAVLQMRLGHRHFETTMIYVEQLKLSLAGYRHQLEWNSILDADLD